MDHKELDAWKESITLVKEIYSVTAGFPECEKFGLMSQMRRCSVSIFSKITRRINTCRIGFMKNY